MTRDLVRFVAALAAPSCLFAFAGRVGLALLVHAFGALAVALPLGLSLHGPLAWSGGLLVSALLVLFVLRETAAIRPRAALSAEVVGALCLATYWPLVLVSAFHVSPLELYRVPSTSMEPTIVPGDLLIVDSWAYTRSPPERGDIVIFDAPTARHVEYVKRVVGLPREPLRVVRHRAVIRGVPLAEPYARIDPPDPTRAELPDVNTLIVAPGHLYVLGDNRTHSVDSRNYGPVPFPVVRARVLAVVWPFTRARGLGPLRFDAEPR
jgi:signal peptidase I